MRLRVTGAGAVTVDGSAQALRGTRRGHPKPTMDRRVACGVGIPANTMITGNKIFVHH